MTSDNTTQKQNLALILTLPSVDCTVCRRLVSYCVANSVISLNIFQVSVQAILL